MVKKQIDKKEDKARRVATAIANLNIGETITPTKLFREKCKNPITGKGMHPDTGRDILDYYSALKEISFEIVRGKDQKVRLIIKTDTTLDLRKQIRDIKNSLISLQNDFDEIKKEIINKKRKS